MPVLNHLNRASEADQQQASMISEAELVAEYNATRRAYAAAVAEGDIESALLWSSRANDIARLMARMADSDELEDNLISHVQLRETAQRPVRLDRMWQTRDREARNRPAWARNEI